MNTKIVLTGVVTALVGLVLIVGYNVIRPAAVVQPPLGATPGSDMAPTGYYSFNGVNYFQGHTNIQATSSILCSFRNPFSATSTLNRFKMKTNSNGFGAAITVDLSTSTGAFTQTATSAPAFLVAASIPNVPTTTLSWYPNATTSPSTRIIAADSASGNGNFTVGPSEWVKVKVATSSNSTMNTYATGSCDATFEQY